MVGYDIVNNPVDLEVIRGDTLKLVFKLSKKLENGAIVPMDVSNLYIFYTIKPDYTTSDENAVLKGSYPVHLLLANSKEGTVVLPIDTTNLESRTYVYDIQFVRYNDSGNVIDVQTPIRGKLSVIPDVTRRTCK
jgi:hypothetical protein